MASDTKTRATLLERLRQATDALAWDEFFHRYWRFVFAVAKGRGCSDHTAEEIVQEAMLVVFHQREVFQYDPARGRFRDWLAAVVRNAIAQLRRRPAEQARMREVPWDANTPEPAVDAQPDAACEAVFEQALLAALLEIVRREVHPRTYQAFELFVLAGLSGADVARTTGLSRNAVYQARKNVLRRLAELGASHRAQGLTEENLRATLRARPSAAVERSIATRTHSAGLNRRTPTGPSSRE